MKELDNYQEALRHFIVQYHMNDLREKYSGQVNEKIMYDEACELIDEEVKEFLAKKGG